MKMGMKAAGPGLKAQEEAVNQRAAGLGYGSGHNNYYE